MPSLRESDYGIGNPCPYDSASPAFYIRDYSQRGKSLNADYAMLPGEDADAYWVRVRLEVTDKINRQRQMVPNAPA